MQTTLTPPPARKPRRRATPPQACLKLRVDDSLKREADRLFEGLGFDTQTAIRIFLNQSVMSGGMPFAIQHLPLTPENLEAMEETERLLRDPNAKSYTDVDEMMREILADV
ncbi:MAG: type II toxin-antitoxin system RelB/DinJ family antitoxin [Kiritimatiellaeota bacterium]|nr:type II toxin-antitoxin system RelB/DinJ family antitoxin [Kiritimatiellota bacterium]